MNAPEAVAERGWLGRLSAGLRRSAGALGSGIGDVLSRRKLDEEALEELEDLLIASDLGVATAAAVRARLATSRFDREVAPEDVKAALAEEIAAILEPVTAPLEIDAAARPHVILVVGVNGTGKTTTIGKLAWRLRAEGRTVLLVAGDTFRAAAIEQLQIWGERAGCRVVARAPGADAAGLAFEALEQARATGTEVLMIDTAGRLQNKAHLMAELEKIARVLKKLDKAAPHSVLLVLDATTGQNAHAQVEVFKEVCAVSGLVMTKLDGTAKGGVLVALAQRFGLPVHAIGVGEGLDDLQPFEARAFARALVGLGD
ncbi:MAG: signal recognition particle-docking protein FtsY [Alphaproteobacteria bacterium]